MDRIKIADIDNERYYQVPVAFFTNPYYKDLSNDSKMAYAILKDKENNFYYQVVVDGNQTHFITPEFVKRFSSKEKAFDEMLFFIANKSFEALKNNGDKDIYSINIIEEMLKEYPNSSILLNVYQQAKDFINSNSNEDYQLLLF